MSGWLLKAEKQASELQVNFCNEEDEANAFVGTFELYTELLLGMSVRVDTDLEVDDVNLKGVEVVKRLSVGEDDNVADIQVSLEGALIAVPSLVRDTTTDD